MVFPASTALDAHASAELKTRLQLILRLAEAGVLVLIDRGKPEQLGTFVRTVLQVEERLDVLTSAYGLTRVDAGSCIVLVPNVHEVAWMNQERPLLAQRRLRVLLYCDKAEAVKIAHGAPDFFHWISHWMEAPTGVWPPALLGLRAAANRNVPIAWEGVDFDAVFAAAFGEAKRVHISASMPYTDLVRSFEQELEWIVLRDVDGAFRRRRVFWAMAESGRQGKVVVLEPAGHIDGFARVTTTPMATKDAEKRLAEANAKHAGRLAAILDCETEAVELAVRLLSNGVSENDCLTVWRDEDPGVALVRMAEHRGIEVPSNAPCVVRANGAGKDLFVTDNLVTASTNAVDAGDFEVAERFARAAIASGETGVDVSILLGHILIARRAAAEAIAVLQDALKASAGIDSASLVRQIMSMRFLSQAYRSSNDFKSARKHIDGALKTLKRLPEAEQAHLRVQMLNDLAITLFMQDDLTGAMRNARAALNAVKRDTLAEGRIKESLGQFLLAADEPFEARDSLTLALSIYRRHQHDEHPDVWRILMTLGRIERDAGNAALSLNYLEQALALQQRIGDSNTALVLDELGKTLYALGELERAQRYLVDACKQMATNSSAYRRDEHAVALHDLGGVLMAHGALDEARDKLEYALRLASPQTQGDCAKWAALELDYAFVLFELGEYDRGLALLEKTHRSLLKKFGPKHKLTQDAAHLLSRVADIPK